MKSLSAVGLLAVVLGLGASLSQAQTIVYPAGAYTITTAGPTTITQTPTSITLSWGVAPTPAPPPVPPPAPTPPPVPVVPASTQLYAIALFDDAAAVKPTPAQVAIRNSATIRAALTPHNAGWAAGDVTTPTLSGWVALAKDAAKPALLIVQVDGSGKGAILPGYPKPLPADEAALIAAVKAHRGAN